MASTGEGTSGLEDNNILFGMTSGFTTFRTTTHTFSSTFLHSSIDTTILEVNSIEYEPLCYLYPHLDLSALMS
jgi:hypothetical protein